MNGVPVARERRLGRVSGRRVVTVPIRPVGRAASTSCATCRGRPHRVRAVRRRAAPPRRAPRRGRAADATHGRPTTSATTTATEAATRGTRGRQQRRGSRRPYLDRGVPPHFRNYDLPFLHWLHRTGRRSTSSRSPTSSGASARRARAGVRPDRLPRPPRVRDDARVRPRPGLPRPRRQPHVPLGEQLLLAGRRAKGDTMTRRRTVARPRSAGGGADRRPVHRQRQGAHAAPWIVARAAAQAGCSPGRAAGRLDRSREAAIEIDTGRAGSPTESGRRRDPAPLRAAGSPRR